MKRFLFVLIFLHVYAICWSQKQIQISYTGKPFIDSTAIVNWPWLGLSKISDDGKFCMYSIENQPVESHTLIIKSTEKNWKKEFVNAEDGFFSPDSRKFIFQSKDTLSFLMLGSDHLSYVTEVNSYKQISHQKDGWLAYLLNNNTQELVLQNMLSGKETCFPGVTNYTFGPGGKSLLIQSHDKNGLLQLQWVNLSKTTVRTIWPTKNRMDKQPSITSYGFDDAGRQLLFMTADTTLWYYRDDMQAAVMKLNNKDSIIPKGLLLSDRIPSFSKNGSYILLQLQKLSTRNLSPANNAVQVDVWSYTDPILPFKQEPSYSPSTYQVAMPIKNDRIIPIQQDNEIIISANGDFALLQNKADIPGEVYWWPSYSEKSYWLVSFENGARERLASIYEWSNITFSPNGRYLVYYDHSKGHYYSYQPSTGVKNKISGDIPSIILYNPVEEEKEIYTLIPLPHELPGPLVWGTDGTTLLIYDDYDIWQLDLEGKKQPLNLTNGFGRKQQIKFQIIDPNNGFKPLNGKTPVLLSGFNNQTKYSGFYRLSVGKSPDPELLTSGAYQYSSPLKAVNRNAWIIGRESATEAPNYYFTRDLKTYNPVTDLQPQKAYNWLTTELVTWQQLDGTTSQGILYKPENFSPQKKYPIIFYYYEQLSQNLCKFLQPGFSTAIINIPWYVSRGYLVFTPDIHYGIANITGKVNGDYAVNSVVSAAQYMARLTYIDSTKMGIQGHSFGGGETLYLITHSNMFAAACAAASTVSNEITAYLGVVLEHGKPATTKMPHSEIGHNKIGATLWQRPDLYIKASPIFQADKVTTPVLLMHNLGDPICDWNQSAQMFMALRRLGKKAWLLQYDNGDHMTAPGKDAIDYTTRLQQFFDHYLKDAPIPRWMSRGIPAYLKGIDTGLQLDKNNLDSK